MSGPTRIFINYRQADTGGEALLLHRYLTDHFGSDDVFLDVRNLQPGMQWLEEIKEHAAHGVFLALIGDRWLQTLTERREAAVANPADDYVRVEIEYALQRGPRVHVVPVVIGDAVPPMADRLPRSLQPLAKLEVAQLRLKRIDEDVAHLIERIETLASLPVQEPPPAPPRAPTARFARSPVATESEYAAPPHAGHYDTILRHMVDRGDIVPVLGPRVNGRPNPFPDDEELAADLAERYGIAFKPADLAEAAQYVFTMSRPELYSTLTEVLSAPHKPGPVHQFLAHFPGMLRALDLPKRNQLIVSTTFDMALEDAFDAIDEPYDLAVYMASGPDKGRFVHFPYRGDPRVISTANEYGGFPIERQELERTVILKIHGAVDGGLGQYSWSDNYVITEDHYIDYLSRAAIGSLVPVQILAKLRKSHRLFLGYSMRDWSLRVFLARIWGAEYEAARSWAIERDVDELEKELWLRASVELFSSDLGDYVAQLESQLAARGAVAAPPSR